jgi:hypothetical protein
MIRSLSFFFPVFLMMLFICKDVWVGYHPFSFSRFVSLCLRVVAVLMLFLWTSLRWLTSILLLTLAHGLSQLLSKPPFFMSPLSLFWSLYLASLSSLHVNRHCSGLQLVGSFFFLTASQTASSVSFFLHYLSLLVVHLVPFYLIINFI